MKVFRNRLRRFVFPLRRRLKTPVRFLFDNHGNGIPVDHLLLQYSKAILFQKSPQGFKGIIRQMIPNQLIITALFQNILQGRHCHKTHTALGKIVVNGLKHYSRLWLVLQKIKG